MEALDGASSPLSNKPETSVAPYGIRWRSLFLGLYAAGLFGFSGLISEPSAYGLSWNVEALLAVVLLSACAGGVALLALCRALPCERSMRIAESAGAALSLSAGALGGVLALTESCPGLALTATTGLGAPFVLYSWALFFRTLPYRSVLLGSVVAFVVAAALSFLGGQFLPSWSCAVLVCVGGVTPWAIGKLDGETSETKPDQLVGGEGASSDKTPCFDKGIAFRRWVLSIPFAGFTLYSFTMGVALRRGGGSEHPELIGLAACVLAIGTAVLYISKLSGDADGRAQHLLHQIGLPALAAVAFVLKMMPVDFVAYTVYREFMEAYFLLILLFAWLDLIRYAHLDLAGLPRACAIAQGAFSIAMATGYFTYSAQSAGSSMLLGFVTAAFLICAVAEAARGAAALVKSPETSDELVKEIPTPGKICAEVAAEFDLTPRETEVLEELACGYSSSSIAQTLCISSNTVRTHMKSIYRKLGINSRDDLLGLLRDRRYFALGQSQQNNPNGPWTR